MNKHYAYHTRAQLLFNDDGALPCELLAVIFDPTVGQPVEIYVMTNGDVYHGVAEMRNDPSAPDDLFVRLERGAMSWEREDPDMDKVVEDLANHYHDYVLLDIYAR